MSGEELLVGIDVGTTLCKAAVVRAADGTEVAHGATRTPWTVVPTAASRSSLASSLGYQSSVKPFSGKLRRESLNEKRISTTIGANRKT